MRTTVTLDPDVEALLRRLMKEKGLSFKAALNQALREGLVNSRPRAPHPYHLKTFRMGFQPEVPLNKALALAAALEDEEIVRKLSIRK